MRYRGHVMNTKYKPTEAEQDAIAEYIVNSVVDDATGTADGRRCVGEAPSARYYLSALSPRDVDFSAGSVRRGRVVPTSAGFEFEVESACTLNVEARCSVYYRVLPTYEEQVAVSDPTLKPED